MSKKLLVLPEALADMERAADWYGARAVSLRNSFLADLELRIERLLEYPEAAPIHRGRIRRLLLGRFPHGVFYVVEEKSIKIIAVLHLKQNADKV